jgi:hypothetical protein
MLDKAGALALTRINVGRMQSESMVNSDGHPHLPHCLSRPSPKRAPHAWGFLQIINYPRLGATAFYFGRVHRPTFAARMAASLRVSSMAAPCTLVRVAQLLLMNGLFNSNPTGYRGRCRSI